jgi:hypothetical protein
MPSIQLKEIRIPSALIREDRPSVAYTILKSLSTALVSAVITFFVVNVSSIAVLGIIAALRRHMVDFSIGYRYIAAPAAIAVFAIVWAGALIFFFRERSRQGQCN